MTANDLITLNPSIGVILPSSLELRENLSFDQWQSIGRGLRRVEKSILWWIGDWLNYGERNYGEMYAQALDSTDFSLGTLQNAKWVASRIESSRRREVLPHCFHQEVASLPPESQSSILNRADQETWTQREIRHAVRSLKHPTADAGPLPAGRFSVIYADPPWRYEHVKTESRAIENQYPTMALDEIRALSVQDLVADDCVLFLWATSPKLAEAMTVIEAWGFVYRTCAVWDKKIIGMGYYFRQQHEFLLVATCGSPGAPEAGDRESSVITWRRGKHSEKPPAAYEMIERMYPKAARIELFARGDRVGWTAWGDESVA